MNASDEVAWRECEALARALARTLPHGMRFAGLEAHSYCGRSHRIARFCLAEPGGSADFVLVPGGPALLGFDGQRFQASDEQIESFALEAEEYGFEESIHDFVEAQTTAPRRASIQPMLVEVVARKLGVNLITPDDPIFPELEQSFGSGTGQTRHYGGSLDGCCVMRESEGAPLRAWRHQPMTLAALEAETHGAGMRLLASDEWEYVCGAGASTLFRWGDMSPGYFYPCHEAPEDYEPDGEDLRGWDLHQRPNLFGLRIAADPYELELVADGLRTRGGDGGCNICGGAGFFFGWLPLATAYHDPEMVDVRSPEDNIADEFHRVRRVIPL